jgi:hypothetical protein
MKSNNRTLMSPRRVLCLAILLATVTLALAPQPIRADDQVPFSAAFVTEFQSVVEFPIAHIAVVGRGRALHLGAATAVTADQAVNLLTGADRAASHRLPIS